MLIGTQVWGLLGALSHTVTEVAVLGGLAGLGYKYHYTVQGSFPWYHGTFLPAALMLLTNLAALAGCVAGCWWFARRMENRAAKVAVKALRWPILTGLAAMVLLLVINGVSFAEGNLLLLRYSPSELGAIYTSKSLATLILWPLVTTAFVVLTILLLRRRFRLSRASQEA
jgi:hypothetical protein